MKRELLKYKTIFISDVHLGSADCKIDQINYLLRNTTCEKLVLNGDIIDSWALKRGGKWLRSHTLFFRFILKKAEKYKTDVIYLRGNHDDFLWRVLPFEFDRIKIVNEHIHESPHGKYICVHGDGFDAVTTNHKWLAVIGDFGYVQLLRLNRVYNWVRKLRGKPYFSLSKAIKAKVKSAVSFVGNYEDQLQKFAKKNNCEGIICGHIHTAADKKIGDIHYLNSGDWAESLTAIVETTDREFKLINFEELKEEVTMMRLKNARKYAVERKRREYNSSLEVNAI